MGGTLGSKQVQLNKGRINSWNKNSKTSVSVEQTASFGLSSFDALWVTDKLRDHFVSVLGR